MPAWWICSCPKVRGGETGIGWGRVAGWRLRPACVVSPVCSEEQLEALERIMGWLPPEVVALLSLGTQVISLPFLPHPPSILTLACIHSAPVDTCVSRATLGPLGRDRQSANLPL